MNASKAISDSLNLILALIADIEAGGSVSKDIQLVVADPKVQASLAALVADILG